MINMSALKPNVSQFPFIFFNRAGFNILLNHMSSQGVSSKRCLPWHCNDLRYQTISCIIIWLCLTRTGNYKIHEFDWLKSILTAV